MPLLQNILKNILHEKKEVSLNGQNIEVSEIRQLTDFIEQRKLQSIDLSNTSLTDESIMVLTRHLSSNQSLSTIDLSNNPLSDNAAIALKEMLQINPFITKLSLDQTQISDQDKQEIARQVQQNNQATKNKASTLQQIQETTSVSTGVAKIILDYVETDQKKWGKAVKEQKEEKEKKENNKGSKGCGIL
jgi:Ran GTPase-activating protein (RanGAP) involved in mRNA processing and transport